MVGDARQSPATEGLSWRGDAPLLARRPIIGLETAERRSCAVMEATTSRHNPMGGESDWKRRSRTVQDGVECLEAEGMRN